MLSLEVLPCKEHKQRCGMPKPTNNPGLLHPHTSCVYFFDWATCTPTETNKTETSKPPRGHISDTPRGWVDVIPHPLEHPRIAPRPPHVPVPGDFSLSAQRGPQRWPSLAFVISKKRGAGAQGLSHVGAYGAYYTRLKSSLIKCQI